MNVGSGVDLGRSETGTAGESELGRVLDAYLAAMESGAPPDPVALAAEHPEIADRLLACISVLKLTSQIGGTEIVDDAAAGARLGDFVLVGPIGRGGMGIVFEARQVSLNRKVALKVLPFASALDPRQLSRFQIEARAAAQLHHTNIVPIFSVGCERGVHFYAMQYIEGKTLSALVREWQGAPEPVAGRHRQVAELGVQAAEALEHAHRQGVVHRDVKPSNLMVDVRNNLWITDFGLARMDGDGGLTAQGDILGTFRYMSPEQSSGDQSRVDHRTDVYSLGATLYELTTLRPVHPGRDREALLQSQASGEPRRPRLWDRSIPRDLETIILRALHPDREHCYATAQGLADDLRRFLDGRPILARRPSVWKRAERWTRRHKALTASLAFAVVLAVAGGAVIATLAARNRDLDRVRRQALYDRDVNQAGHYVQRNNLAAAARILSAHIPEAGDDDERSFPWHYLWRLCQLRPQQLKGHIGDVYHVVYSPEGKSLATAGQDGSARIWDASTGACLRIFRGHEGDVDCTAFSPDGRTLATCGDDGTVRLWNMLDENEPSVVMYQGKEEVVSLLFTPDGRSMITGDAGGQVKLWDVATGRDKGSLPSLNTRINSMALSPDGRTLATAAETGVKFSDIQSPQRELGLLELGHTNCVVFSHDGRLVAAGGPNGRANLATIGTNLAKARELDLAVEPSFGVQGLAFSPDDRIVAGCGNDGYLCFWDADSGRVLKTYRSGRHRLWGVGFSPDGRWCVACGHDGAVEVWNTADAQDRATTLLPFSIGGLVPPLLDEMKVTIAPRTSAGLPNVVNWDLVAHRVVSPHVRDLPLCDMGVFSPDGAMAALYRGRGRQRFQLLSVDGRSSVPSLELSPNMLPDEGSTGTVSLVFSADGSRLAARIHFRGIFVWDVATGRLIATYLDEPGLSVAFSPVGDRLAIVNSGCLSIRRFESAYRDNYLDSGIGGAGPVVFTPDGRRVVVGSPYTKALAVWYLDDPFARPNTVQVPEGPFSLAVSPDGKTLASGGIDGGVRLVDLTTFHPLMLLDGPREPVQQLRFSSDGLILMGLSSTDTGTPVVLTVWTCAPSRRLPIRSPGSGSR